MQTNETYAGAEPQDCEHARFFRGLGFQTFEEFCGYKAVLLGLAADAAAICNDFTRFCDSESESDISELTMEARKFMLSAQALFLQEQVFALPTFTKSVVDVAARGPFQILVDGRAVEVKITEDDKRRAVQVFKDAFLNFGLLLFYSFNLVMLFHIAVECLPGMGHHCRSDSESGVSLLGFSGCF